MDERVYSMLKDAAQRGTLLTYTEAGEAIGLSMDNPDHRNEISSILDEVSLHEHRQGRPLLSVVVIRQDLGRPGHGFYEMAKRTGLYNGRSEIDQVV